MKYIKLCLFLIIFIAPVRGQVIPDLEIINRSYHFFLSSNGMVASDTVLIQINNRNANTEINIPYSKGDKISISNAWIEDAEGNIIRKLRMKDVKDRSSISNISLYEDDFVKYFDLKHDVFPYRIYYTSQIRYARSLNTIEIDHAWSKIPVQSAKLIVETPVKDSVRLKYKNVEDPEIIIDSRNKIYYWQYRYEPPKQFDVNAIKEDLRAPFIQVIPLRFKFGVEGSFDSWQSFGNWVYRLNKNRDKLTSDEIKRIDDLLRFANSEREKAELLYSYLQRHTRYINVSIKLGGLQTHPASYVCDHKYGDCKALTNYMQAMLKYAGITSYYTLIEAGRRVPEFDVNFPSQAFNHAILTLPLDNDTLFLECTEKNIPFGYISTYIQGRKALLIDEENSHIIEIPSIKPEDNLSRRLITVIPEEKEISLHETARGAKYELYSYLKNEIDRNNVSSILGSYIFAGKTELLEYHFENKDQNKAEIDLSVHFRADNIYRKYGKNIILPPFPMEIVGYESPDTRTSGVQLDYPACLIDTVVYHLNGNEISKMPEGITISSDFGKYEHNYNVEGGNLILYKSLELSSGRYPLERYDDFYHFISSVRTHETKNIHIETY